MNRTSDTFRELLACPDCKSPLQWQENQWMCGGCGETYSSLNGVPVLLSAESPDRIALHERNGKVMTEGYMNAHSGGMLRRIYRSARRVVTSEFFPGRAWRAAKQRVISKSSLSDSLLVIGSGVTRYERGVHLDLDAFPGVDVIGDATALPFPDNRFEGVICEVVLEHVYNPNRVIEEAFRVLKPGGSCFFIVPFLFPFHGHPSDYRRWSKAGLEADFARFSHVETGIHGGPTSSLVNLITEWMYIASGQTFPRGYTLIKGVGTLVLFPFKFLDFVLNRFPEAHRLASTLYIYAEKRS